MRLFGSGETEVMVKPRRGGHGAPQRSRCFDRAHPGVVGRLVAIIHRKKV